MGPRPVLHVQAVETAEFMGETANTNVLGRIAAAGREERQARAMTLPKAMRLTLAKVADALMDLPLAVIGAVVAVFISAAAEFRLHNDGETTIVGGGQVLIKGIQPS